MAKRKVKTESPEQKKKRQDYEHKTNKLLIVGTPKIEVPSEMIYHPKKGKDRIIHTLTKTGVISKRNKKPVIVLDDTGEKPNTINIIDSGMSHNINKLYHSSAIHNSLSHHFRNKHDDLLKDISKLNPKLKKDKLVISKLNIEQDRFLDGVKQLENKSHRLFTKLQHIPKERGSKADKLYNRMMGYK